MLMITKCCSFLRTAYNVYLDFLGHHDLNPLKKHTPKQVNMFIGAFNPCMFVSLDHHTNTVENKQCLNLNTPTTNNSCNWPRSNPN